MGDARTEGSVSAGMTPSEALLGLSPGSTVRNQAAAALLSLLNELARNLPADLRNDAVSAVAVRVVEKSPLSVVVEATGPDPELDAASKAYLRAMLNHWVIDQQRRRKPTEREGAEEGTVNPVGGFEEAALRAQYGKELEALARRAVEERPTRYRKSVEKSWRQLKALSLEGLSVEQILARDEGITETSSETDRSRARDSLYQRSKRTREYLLEAAPLMEDDGQIDAETRAVLTRIVTGVLIRCQTRGR